ncbi:MAG TPA: MerR family transcriptional regulator [Thermomicrobiales bacterium]|nr:MerR family transcriptional regulator [Thermomicrobiales bacterium]
MTIGEIAARAGMNTSALRFYERVGLLPVARRVNGQRRYDPDVLAQLALIRMAQEANFTIEEIRTLTTGFPEGTPPSERWQELAQRKLPEVAAMIDRLETVRLVLEESLRCDCLTLDACARLGWNAQASMPANQ